MKTFQRKLSFRCCFRTLFRSSLTKGIFLGTLFIIFYVSSRKQNLEYYEEITTGDKKNELEQLAENRFLKRSNETYKDWREVEGSGKELFIYSAYYDTRVSPSVRLIAILKKTTKVTSCRIWTRNGKTFETSGSSKKIHESWGMAYTAAFVICNVKIEKDDVVLNVAVATNKASTYNTQFNVIDISKRNWEGDFSVCVKPFHFNYNRAIWLIEFIELHRLLGVQKFFFYNHTVGENVEKVLQYYMREGMVEVYPWSLPVKSQSEIRTEGIFAALNDCNVRNVGRFKHTIMIDLDEYIIPKKVHNYTALISSLGDKASYVFQNDFFYLYWDNDTAVSNSLYGTDDALGTQIYDSEKNGPYLLTMYKTTRVSTPHKHGKRSKYINKPERTLECGNHVVWEYVGPKSSVNVPANVALSHHYRICEFGGFDCLKNPHEIDRTTHKYLVPLVKSISSVCSKVFTTLKTCPDAPPLGSPW